MPEAKLDTDIEAFRAIKWTPNSVREMTTARLLQLQERINLYFVRRRDKGLMTDIIYGRLRDVERELGRRRIGW